MGSAHVVLWCGTGVIEVGPSLAAMALPRVHVPAFSVGSGFPRLLRVDRVACLEGQLPRRVEEG